MAPKRIKSVMIKSMMIRLILIGAWVLDIEVLDNFQSQITVGVFFFLLSFTASNAVQKRWNLAAGWGILAVADLIVLAWLNVWAQAIASLVGLVGIVVLGIEFYKQYLLNKAESTNKKR